MNSFTASVFGLTRIFFVLERPLDPLLLPRDSGDSDRRRRWPFGLEREYFKQSFKVFFLGSIES